MVKLPPGPPSSTPTSGSAHKYTGPSRLYPKQKEIRAGPGSGSPVSQNLFTSGLRGSFPSRVQSLGDSCTRTPSILPPGTNLFSSVPAYGVTQLGLRSYLSLGRLYRRPLQRHFHSLGMTNRFTPLRRSDTLVLANLLRHWQDLRFLTSGIHTFQADFTIFTEASTQGLGTHMGDSQISGIWTRTDHKFPFPHLVTFDSRASPLVRGSEHILRARHIPGCLDVIADHPSHPNQPISTEWALHPEIVKRIFRLWGTPGVDMFATVSISHLPRLMSPIPEPRALVVDALSQDWQGRSMYMFPPFPLLNKVIQKLRSTQAAEVFLVAHWWPKQSWFSAPTSSLCGSPLCFTYRGDLLSQQDQKYVLDGKSYHLHAWRLSCDTIKQQAFQTRSLGSPQPLRGPQPIACTTIGGFASLLGLQGKGLIRLIPQLLR